MTLAEAIEIKLHWKKANYPTALEAERKADMLSIEALRRLVNNRKSLVKKDYTPLPGEF